MPKSGLAQQWCPCGSNLRPHLALAVRVSSLHVRTRVGCQQTVYVCESCIQKFNSAMERQQPFSRTLNAPMRDRLLGVIGGALLGVWEEIQNQVPG